MTEQTIT